MFRNFNNVLCIYRERNIVGIGLSLGSYFLAQVMLFCFGDRSCLDSTSPSQPCETCLGPIAAVPLFPERATDLHRAPINPHNRQNRCMTLLRPRALTYL